MKKILFASVITIFAFISFGYTSDLAIKEPKSHPCPYIQKMNISEECPFSRTNDSVKSECPYLGKKSSECPHSKGGRTESESGVSPNSGKQESKKSDINQAAKLLEIKIS